MKEGVGNSVRRPLIAVCVRAVNIALTTFAASMTSTKARILVMVIGQSAAKRQRSNLCGVALEVVRVQRGAAGRAVVSCQRGQGLEFAAVNNRVGVR